MDPQQFDLLLKALKAPAAWKTSEIISSIVLILGFMTAIASLIYARFQVQNSRRALLADQRRSQRQLAMQMCQQWSNFTSPETASVTRLVERMTQDQCEAVANSGKLIIATEHTLHLINILQLRFPDVEAQLEKMKRGEMYELEGQYVLYLRHIAVRYLNMLESILLAWTMAIADQEIIENEFSYLFNEAQRRTAMENLRLQIGMDGFPAIRQFMMALRAKTLSGSPQIQRPPII